MLEGISIKFARMMMAMAVQVCARKKTLVLMWITFDDDTSLVLAVGGLWDTVRVPL